MQIFTQEVTGSGKTDVGCNRSNNEDSYIVDNDYDLWIVADGMGGHAGGEVASKMAVNTVHAEITNTNDCKEAIRKAHDSILQKAENSPDLNGMGTTIVILRIIDGNYEITWVGDSRCYLHRNGQLICLSKDHSYLQKLIDLGKIKTEAEILDFPAKNIITQAVGIDDGELKIDEICGKAKHGDRFLLCSDGLSDVVDNKKIEEIISSADLQSCSEKLINEALNLHGNDNITAIVTEYRRKLKEGVIYDFAGLVCFVTLLIIFAMFFSV